MRKICSISSKILICLLSVPLILSLTSCSKKAVSEAEDNVESTEDSSEFVNYKTGVQWFTHNVINMDEETVQYYAIKELYITKVERLILEDYYITGGSLDKDSVTIEDFLMSISDENSDIYKFYNAMRTSEEELTAFVYDYMTVHYSDVVDGSNAETFFKTTAKNYFSGINQFDVNTKLKDEVIEYLQSFKITPNGWISYNIKDKYISHFEMLKQFVPSEYDIVTDKGYFLLARRKDNRKKYLTLIQDPKTGEVYSIDIRAKITDLMSYYSFNIEDYLPKEKQQEEEEIWEDTVENREEEGGIIYTDITDQYEEKEVDQVIMNAWDEDFKIRQDETTIDKLNVPELINKGYNFEFDNTDSKQQIIKKDNTGKMHIITIVEE